jgi:hypothetical protein
MPITKDATAGNSGSFGAIGGHLDCNLTHAANVLVIITIAVYGTAYYPSYVRVGGDDATILAQIANTSNQRFEVRYIFRASGGTEAISVGYSGVANITCVALSLLGTVRSEPFIETLSTNQGYTTSKPFSFSVNVAAGSVGRIVLQCCGVHCQYVNSNVTIAPTAPQTELAEQLDSTSYGMSAEINGLNSQDAETMQATATVTSGGGTSYWATAGFGVLALLADFAHAGSQLV